MPQLEVSQGKLNPSPIQDHIAGPRTPDGSRGRWIPGDQEKLAVQNLLSEIHMLLRLAA